MNAVDAEVLGFWLPARTTVVGAALAKPGFRGEIEKIAVVRNEQSS